MRLAARERGTGPGVVLLHGLFGRGRNFGALQLRLSERFRVVALDLRNHGDSPHAPDMDYATLAADVMETLDAIGMARCSLVGHSMGGKVAMRAALDHPDRIDRLLVADIAPVAYATSLGAYAQAMRDLALPSGLTRAEANQALSGAVPDPTIRGFLLQNLRIGEAPHWTIGLAEIAAAMTTLMSWPKSRPGFSGPTLFVAGELSDYIAEAERAAIASLFPQARIVVLGNAGHWVHADDPEGFLRVARIFLEQQGK
jgi:pimeloyl-ACP methyl ester carboxylesterase